MTGEALPPLGDGHHRICEPSEIEIATIGFTGMGREKISNHAMVIINMYYMMYYTIY